MKVHDEKVTLAKLRPGALFITDQGVLAVKSEYTYGSDSHNEYQYECVILESGEYAHFPEKNETLVREVEIEADACEHHFIVRNGDWNQSPRAFTLRYCKRCGMTYRLVWYSQPERWVWERIPEVEQSAFRSEEE